MASKVPDEPPCNTQETDEETIAFRKKRSRRVSFADREITSVHIFNRDEDYETPPDSTPRPASGREKEVLGLFRDLVDCDDSNGDDDNEDEDDDVLSGRKSFLRPLESPSPGGSSILGSATSNDEDNFFGPVSANFIRPGRLSDSAASDDKHDITMDSTAFSMHFRSIVQSESGELTTSAGFGLASEEKTPSQATLHSDPESLMVLTKVNRLKSPSPMPIDKFSSGKDSNDMSLVGESLHKYDYGKLSPTLEAILAEGSKEFNAIPASDATSSKLPRSELAVSHTNESNFTEPMHDENLDLCNISNLDVSGKDGSIVQNNAVETTGDSATTLIGKIVDNCLSNPKDGSVAESILGHQIHIPNLMNKGNKDISDVTSTTSLQNSELLAVITATPLTKSGEAVKIDSFQQFEYENGSPRDGLKKHSTQDKIHPSNVGHASNQPHGSPFGGSIYSLSAKRQQILLDKTNSPRSALFVTPSPKKPGSILSNGSKKQGGSMPPLLKSNSKLNVEPSPHASALNDGTVNSKLRSSLSLSSGVSPFNTVMEEMSKSPKLLQENVPIVNLEEQLFGADLKQKEDSIAFRTTTNISSLIRDGGTTVLGEDKDYNDNSTERMTRITSASEFTHSEKEVTHHSLTSVDPVDKTIAGLSFNSSSAGITLETSKDKRDVATVHKLVSPSVDRLNQQLSLTTEFQGSLSNNFNPQDQDNSTIIFSRKVCSSEQKDGNNNYLTPTAENRVQHSSPLMKGNGLVDSFIKRVDERESNELDLRNTSETPRKFLPDGVAMKLRSVNPKKNIQAATESSDPSDNFIFKHIKVSSANDSPDAHISKNEQSPRKSPSGKRLTQSPASKEPTWSNYRKEPHGDDMQLSVAKDVVSFSCSSTVQNIEGHDLRSLHSLTHVQDIHDSSKRKRISGEEVLADVQHANKRNCKVGEDYMEHMNSNESNREQERANGGKTLMNQTDITLKLSADTNQLLSPASDKLNIKMINMLEDMLLHRQKINICEMLCSEVQSQLRLPYDESRSMKPKRIAETRRLLCGIVYEKTKLQLMHVKRERLLKQVELLRSRVQESQMLKLNCMKHPLLSAKKNSQLDDSSHSVRHGGNVEGASDKVTTMKHEADTLEKKIKNLSKSFQIYCKMKGEPSCSDTIEFVNDHLKKRTCCRFIRQDMQLWEVDDLQNKTGDHNVVLNYHGFIYQSLKLNGGPNSSIIVANKVNDLNITKNFPNMDACSAFAFVFNDESTKNVVGPKSMAQETQRTSALLRNLLDVVEEVHIARLDIRNLTLTRFHSPSAEQLDLQLCFIDFNRGVKVMIILDMTLLNCGVYPSEVLPHRIQTPSTGPESLQLLPLSAEIKAAVGNLRAGYQRIINLCRSVSQVMQSSGK